MQERAHTDRPARIVRKIAVAVATAALGLLATSHWALAQTPPALGQPSSPQSPSVQPSTQQPRPKQAAVRPQQPRAEAKPIWAELTASQQQALAPLAPSWSTLSEGHKRKWLALSQNYPKMQPEEQAVLRGRMTEWAALTPQQRTQARLNFAEAKKLPVTDKKAMWEAYQALPPEEKRKLAASATVNKPPPPPIAAAVKPVPPQKLAKTPKPKTDAPGPRIAIAPEPHVPATVLGAPAPPPTLPAPAARPAASR
ncbi:MAG: DUF3106 domain-containing protein [Pseudomonadota bacterium]